LAGDGSFVLDASVAVKWYLVAGEDQLEEAAQVLAAYSGGRLDLVAPDAIFSEVVSAITVATLGRQPRITRQLGRLAIVRFLDLELRTLPGKDFLPAAFDLVHQYGCALYDAIYLALAQRLGIAFITADGKLYQRIGHLPEVVWLGDYTGADR